MRVAGWPRPRSRWTRQDLEGPVDGGFRVRGAPERAVSWDELAAANGGALAAHATVRDPGETFPFGTHVAVVEVDTSTGDVRLVRLIAADDCGRILNPVLVRGQQHGGIAQGSGRRSSRRSCTTSRAIR